MSSILLLFAVSALVLANSRSDSFEIVYPVRLDKHRDRRDLSTRVNDVLHEEEALFGLKTKKGDFDIHVKRTKGFHSDKILLRTFDDNGVGQNTEHAPPRCFYHGQILNNKHSEVVINTCSDNGIRGQIDDGEKSYHIEPVEDSETEGAHKFYEAPHGQDDGVMEGVSFGDDTLYPDDVESDPTLTESARPTFDANKFNKLALVPGVEPQYIKYLTTTKTRYCEMFLVVDNAVYRQYGNDSKVVTQNMLNVVHHVDRSYAAINIRIVLVGVEIWTDKNKIDYFLKGGEQVSAFNKYRRENLLKLLDHDIAHYMSKRSWSGGVIGMAYMNGVCSKGHGSGINLWSFGDVRGPAGVLGHELGHNFDFPHDADMKNCVCLTRRGCFMGGSKSRRNGFTTCNMQRLAKRPWTCINNYPKGVISNKCGNGIKEGDEECDCGSPEMCKRNDPCCQPNGCKLKRSAQCSDTNGKECCKNCLFRKEGTLCREAKGTCDLPEYCSGKAETCPADLYRKDGTTCDNHASILKGNTNRNSEHTVVLTPSIKARYLRFNPVYNKPNGDYFCMRLEVLTCTADEDTAVQLNPISTRDLYYTSSLCLMPESSNCSESSSKDPNIIMKKLTYSDCNKPNLLFKLEKDGTLRHHCSGKIVCPDSTDYLFLKTSCPDGNGQYERLANFGLRHKKTGKCVEASNGWPGWPDGSKSKLRGTKDCDGSSNRAMLHFLAQDCLLPVGMENKKLPNSALSASKDFQEFKANEVRLQTGKGWCLSSKAGKNEYLQVDLGKIKTVGRFKMQGARWSWVTGLRLYYSDDSITWKEYQKSGDPDNSFKPYCFSGKCGSPVNTQCKGLWDAEASSANSKCWKKLNTEAAGFGTCHPASNKTCATENLYCGQIQCKSSKDKPYHVNYGTQYKKINASGEICSAGSITIPSDSGSDEVGNGLGMVSDGTRCGTNKMCFNYKCQSFTDLKIKECGKVNNLTCAGRGLCDNKGVCHCQRGYDPSTNCEKVRPPINGNWGAWKEWTACSAACNGGTRRRSRFCDAPIPAHGGSECPGDQKVNGTCNTQACPKARSCRDMMSKLKAEGKPMIDNVYDIHMDDGTVMKMYCDMTSDGGGWTLVVSSHSNTWTSAEMVRERNISNPHLTEDYSMLKYADKIKDSYLIASKTYEFKLEAQNRGRWGGIWEAASEYLTDSNLTSQTNIVLKKKFDNWVYQQYGLKSIVPYVEGNKLSMNNVNSKWGKLTGNTPGYHPSPWISGHLQEEEPEHIWYWMREGEIKLPTSCMEIKFRRSDVGKVAKSGKYLLKDKDGKTISTWCNMESFSGGWTLLVNKISGAGWNKETMLSRNVEKASLSEEFSILYHSKAVMGMRKDEKVFQYMIEADGKHQWGGIFEGAINDGLTSCTPSAKKPKLLKKFSNWNESTSDLMKTNPFVVDNLGSLLTTSLNPTTDKTSGILVSQTKSIYMSKVKETPSFVRLWIREAASYESCNQLKTKGSRLGGVYKDGYHNIKGTGGNMRTVYCDMTSDAGAWTLLVTSATGGWTKPQVLSRNEDKPSVSKDYSILHLADSIKNLSNNKTFKYKLCAAKFNRWGGIWEAPIGYTFVRKSASGQETKLIQRFDDWTTAWYASPNNRMPWLGGKKGILTTSGTSDWWWYGTIISDNTEFKPAPWMYLKNRNPGLIWYFVNEDDCDSDRRQIDGGLTPWSMWSKCSTICGQGKQTRERSCTLPKPRCGGEKCAGETVEKRSCSGKCKVSPIKSANSLFCVLPKSGGCSVSDDTNLVWRSGIEKCDLPEAQFVFDADSGSIIHNCSGKPVCGKNGAKSYSNPIVISSKCPAMTLTRRFVRNFAGSLSFGDMCLHPSGGRLSDNVPLVLWSGCYNAKTKQNFYKLERGPVHVKFWSSLKLVNSSVVDLTSDVRFPNNPTHTGYTDNFEMPDCMGDKYGAQLSSYFVAPETGLYTFFAACDDYCQVLFSSTSALKKDAKAIITVSAYTSRFKYDSRAEQKSSEINLEVGKKYYIEALLVENGGSGFISVAYKLPSGKQTRLMRSSSLRAKAN